MEQEQAGKERAEYGKRVLELASLALTEEFGKGFGLTSVKNMRSFYLTFRNLQIGQTMLDQFKIEHAAIRQAPLDESTIPFYPNLSWLHYERLMRVKDETARLWYLKETAREQWSYRTLQRNISSQYYNRLLQTPDRLRQEVSEEMHCLTADFERDRLSYLKNPVIAEFLGLPRTRFTVKRNWKPPLSTICRHSSWSWVKAMRSWHVNNTSRPTWAISILTLCFTT